MKKVDEAPKVPQPDVSKIRASFRWDIGVIRGTAVLGFPKIWGIFWRSL